MVAADAVGRSSEDAMARETDRLAALGRLDFLDTPRDEGFERIVRLIKKVFSVDIALISLIDAHRQWYKACSGMSGDQAPRKETFCNYVIEFEEPFVVQDVLKDSRFSKHPSAPGEDAIRFYAGVPLRTSSGHVVGTVCANDHKPREFGSEDVAILQELADVAMDRIELMQSAATDGLTEALTRRAFKQAADRLISLALRQQKGLACIVLDIDHFKTVNDTHGHAAGDEVLRSVAAVCKATLRTGDVFGRLGGEEFAILLPNVDQQGAVAIAEKVRTAISSQQICGSYGVLSVTASLGSSALSSATKDIETLLVQADAAMYEAKHSGRNRCVSWSSIAPEHATGARKHMLRAGSILFNDRRSMIDCTIQSLGVDSASLSVCNTTGIPAEFVLRIKDEGFEKKCQMIAQDRHNLEVAFR
ncbi:sensor domain-containing diguanylate cyclase [Pararhizobium antarcticum]|uniref:diguanylate cyclase n=1 Tax=Pararhizobium antarcticum TaxID=1798805 RepID=A0A657LNF0_9HYPH|nr:sensor domain-containing diguanylate cyclase [Pararhizobium antarcticum]OJF92967.1 diguanylate cyclase [Pararhizobium antarcticum]OJF98219.1 diguanylate cyclase [Rhizobium sp. 58]